METSQKSPILGPYMGFLFFLIEAGWGVPFSMLVYYCELEVIQGEISCHVGLSWSSASSKL